jgi:nucleoside-diphosphate kinase
MEKTLVIIKPDAIQRGLEWQIIQRFEDAGFSIAAQKREMLTTEILTEHYAHIADKPFFPFVLQDMQASEVIILALEWDNVVETVRTMIGVTDPALAAEGTIRKDFGIDKGKNSIHASEDSDAAKVELERFFK